MPISTDLLVPRFSSVFEPALIAHMASIAELMEVNAGTNILDIGQTVKIMPILLEGTLKVSRSDEEGKEILLYYVHSNESCAMTFTCCMQQFPSEIKATAETNIRFLAIPMSAMDEWMTKYTGWKSFVMKTIRFRFHELLHTIDQLAFHKLDERLVFYLKEKSKANASALINLSHEQIAHEMGSSREVISRLLKKLEIDHKLLLYRNQIKLLGNWS